MQCYGQGVTHRGHCGVSGDKDDGPADRSQADLDQEVVGHCKQE